MTYTFQKEFALSANSPSFESYGLSYEPLSFFDCLLYPSIYKNLSDILLNYRVGGVSSPPEGQSEVEQGSPRKRDGSKKITK